MGIVTSLSPALASGATATASAATTVATTAAAIATRESRSRLERDPPPLPSPSSFTTNPTPDGSTQTSGNAAGASLLPPPNVLPLLLLKKSIVSGFVGISGVYDIPRMGANAVGGMLAREVFGTDRRAWARASPVHCVRATAAAATAATVAVADRSSDGVAATAEAAVLSRERTVGKLSSDSLRGGRDIECDPNSHSCIGGDGAGTSSTPDFLANSTSTVVGGNNVGSTAATGTAAAAIVVCPLLHTEALLVTASTDFHLKDDAEALMEALSDARRAVDGLSIERSEHMLTGAGGQSSRTDSTTGGVLQAGREGGDVGGEGQWQRGNEARHGSIRHVCLEGEDHFSTMVSFGEPGRAASETVLEFILNLPPP